MAAHFFCSELGENTLSLEMLRPSAVPVGVTVFDCRVALRRFLTEALAGGMPD
jgi:hypothetical protein